MDWQKLWNDIVTFFSTNVWRIVAFFATLFVGALLIRAIMYALRKSFSKTRLEKITQQFILTTIKFLLWFALVLGLVGIMGIELTGVITAFSAILLAVGMALENNIANLANGIVIVCCQMFKKGDYITVDGKEGSIVDINFLFTTLHTTDNKRITIPNSTIVNNAVVNAGANDMRRVDFTFSVAYETDVEAVKKIVLDCMASNGKVYLTEGKMPFCRLKTLNASSIDFFAYCWCDTEDYWDVYYYVIETVYNEFKKHGISIPYNQMEIRARTDEVTMPYNPAELPQRVEKVRATKQSEFAKIKAEAAKRRKVKQSKKKKAKMAHTQSSEPQAAQEDVETAPAGK